MSDNAEDIPSGACKICKIVFPPDLMVGEYCKPEENFRLIRSIADFGKNLVYILLVTIVFSFFNQGLRSYIIILLVLAFLPTIILNVYQVRIHYRGVPAEYRIKHMIRMYHLRKELNYYTESIHATKELENMTEDLKLEIINELLNSVLLTSAINPINLFEDWSSAFGMTEEEFVNYLFEKTEIIEGFGVIGGTGLLPEVMNYPVKEEYRIQIYDELLKSTVNFEMVTDNDKQYFLEDLYLIYDDIKEELEGNDKYLPIIELMDEFEPEKPPKNAIEQMRANIEEQQKQMTQRQNL